MASQTLTLTSRTKETGQRRQCWECTRRRLVCDSTKPHCNKCRVSGTECPGYGERKPLKWLAPGKVKSRNRKSRYPLANKGSGNDTIVCTTNGKKDQSQIMHRQIGEEELDIAIPVIGLESETCAIVRAIDYCMSFPTPSGTSLCHINN